MLVIQHVWWRLGENLKCWKVTGYTLHTFDELEIWITGTLGVPIGVHILESHSTVELNYYFKVYRLIVLNILAWYRLHG